jgi:ribosomal protein L11 methyltransferase
VTAVNSEISPSGKQGSYDDAYVEINVSLEVRAFEALADFFIRTGSGGISYSDDPRKGECRVTAYYLPENAGEIVRQLDNFFGELKELGLLEKNPDVKVRLLPNEDWIENWKKHFHPIPIGTRLVIKPEWESYTPDNKQTVIEINPGMAFGTGTHPTTALCLEELEKLVRGGEMIADIGTGSGILSIAAIKLGAKRADAVDIDAEAVKTTKANARINQVTESMWVSQGSAQLLLDEGRYPYDIVLMNIVADVIIENAPILAKLMSESGCGILSGIIDTRENQVITALKRVGLTVVERRIKDEWILLAVKGEKV